MGFRTLSDFRGDLQSILGARAFGRNRLNSWVNDGYFELTAGFDFQELVCIQRVNVNAGVDSFDPPDDLQTARTMTNLTDNKVMIHVDLGHFLDLDPDVSQGPPTHWTILSGGFRVWPPPDVTTEIRIMYNRFPDELTIDSQQTLLTPTWDRAVLMFAASHALLDLNEEQRSVDWRAQGLSYVRSRLTQEEFSDEAGQGGVGVARSASDVTDLRT